jgi:hypothetical protein
MKPIPLSFFRGDEPGAVRSAGIACVLAAVLVTGLSCGIKAPPVPRETVVPSPVREISVRRAGDGVVVEFTFPATSLDGGKLQRIAGYRLGREGPDGSKTETEEFFSFSQQSALVGKKVSVPGPLPPGPGIYRYFVLPLDAYGSHAREEARAAFSRDPGAPSDSEGVKPPKGGGEESPGTEGGKDPAAGGGSRRTSGPRDGP